jgi:hypothetical protein
MPRMPIKGFFESPANKAYRIPLPDVGQDIRKEAKDDRQHQDFRQCITSLDSHFFPHFFNINFI